MLCGGVWRSGRMNRRYFVFSALALAVGRKQVDACRGIARELVTLSFTWVEIGIARRTKVLLLNPLISRTG